MTMNNQFTQYMATGCLLLLFTLGACKKDSSFKHQAGQPMTIASFTPETGGRTTQILITGSNFSTNLEEISVFINGNRLPVVGANGDQIMAVVPRKCGSGKVKVKIGTDSVESTATFHYIFTRTVSTFAGSGVAGFANGQGTEAQFNFSGANWYRSGGLVLDDDLNLYVADPGNHCIRKVDSTGMVTTFAGSPGNSGHAEGIGTAARFSLPYSIAIDNNRNLYVADPANWDIRKITPDGNAVSYAWAPVSPWAVAVDNRTGYVYYTGTDAGNIYEVPAAFTSNTIGWGFSYPAGIAVGSNGDIYVSCNGDHTIRKMTAGSWTSSIIAGQAGVAGYQDGPGAAAKFANPWYLAVDRQDNIYLAANGTWNGATDSPDQSIRFIEAGTWAVNTFAGSGTAGYIDAIGKAAAFSAPTGVAVDKNGTVYVMDKNNNRIRKIVSD